MTSNPSDIDHLKKEVGGLTIAEVLNRFPQARGVLYNHFGASCFECPAKEEEPLSLGILVHSTDEEPFYSDLLAALGGESEQVG